MAKKAKDDVVIAALRRIEHKVVAEAFYAVAKNFSEGSTSYAEMVSGILFRASVNVAMNGGISRWWIDQYSDLAQHIKDHHLPADPASPEEAEASAA